MHKRILLIENDIYKERANNNVKQAGAELCQAQVKLGLAMLDLQYKIEIVFAVLK